jgi:4-alpha-glucanotransferase
MPPAAAFLTGEQVTIRAKLGLLTRPEAEERAAAQADAARWLAMLAREGLLGGPAPGSGSGSEAGSGAVPSGVSAEEFTVALYRYLTRTPARLIGVSLAEAAGERRPQNMPGTVDQYPNWRIPLSDAEGRPVLLEDLPGHPGVRAVAAAVSGGLRR